MYVSQLSCSLCAAASYRTKHAFTLRARSKVVGAKGHHGCGCPSLCTIPIFWVVHSQVQPQPLTACSHALDVWTRADMSMPASAQGVWGCVAE